MKRVRGSPHHHTSSFKLSSCSRQTFYQQIMPMATKNRCPVQIIFFCRHLPKSRRASLRCCFGCGHLLGFLLRTSKGFSCKILWTLQLMISEFIFDTILSTFPGAIFAFSQEFTVSLAYFEGSSDDSSVASLIPKFLPPAPFQIFHSHQLSSRGLCFCV